MCICDDGGIVTADDEDSDLTLEVEDEEEPEGIDVFEATREWKVVKEGQAIPPGLHIRMNLQTGEKEARLMPDSAPDDTASTKEGENGETRDTKTPQSTASTSKEQPTGTKGSAGPNKQPHPGFIFRGDHRRDHHYGHSDRRGIINKRRRVFTQREVAEALRKMDESGNADLTKLPSIAYSKAAPAEAAATHSQKSGGVRIVQQDGPPKPRLEKPMHRDLIEMMQHTKTLARQTATVAELLQALEELEYHVHHIENARELNTIGGLVVVVRLLNHTHPDIRSGAAHVIGAAAQR